MHFQATPAGIVSALTSQPQAPERRSWLKRLGLLLGGGLLARGTQAAPRQVQGNGDFVGQIILFAGNYPPLNYAFCDGSVLSISSYQALFVLLGTNYGGNGQTTFALPDLRGRVPLHVGGTVINNNTNIGTGPGLSTRTLGQQGGTETVTLAPGQLPAHTHALQGTASTGTAANPSGALLANDGRGGPQYATTGTAIALSNQSIGATGGGLPHDNMPPFLGLNYCICVSGVFPPRN
jgi:prepilin-type processing-associated H-X9-DG protein